jgi:hypothetical protein
MERAPTALHRAAAWCAAALFLALVLVGTRTAMRALVPDAESETVSAIPSEAELVDVDDGQTLAPPRAGASAFEAEASVQLPRSARRAVRASGDEPMQKHPACVIEGSVRSVSGLLQQPVELRVEHPTGGTAPTRLVFDRTAADGAGRVASFKLVKPVGGDYVLRPVVLGMFDYDVEPPQRRIGTSTGGADFVVRDDVPHVDLDVLVLGSFGEELPQADLRWRVHRGVPLGIDDLLGGELASMRLEPGRGPELQRVPVTNVLECFVTAEGYRPHRAVIQLVEGQTRHAVGMQPGWGVFLVDMAVGRKLSGQAEPPSGEIRVDGRRVGSTHPSGVTYVETDVVPRELAVLFEGRPAALLRSVPRNRLVARFDHTLLEPAGFVPVRARD